MVLCFNFPKIPASDRVRWIALWERKLAQKPLMGKVLMSNFSLMGTQNASKTPYGKSFGWTPYTLGGGCIRPYQDWGVYKAYIAMCSFTCFLSRKPYARGLCARLTMVYLA